MQTASLVLCYSRMIFFQFYPNFTRFHCKVFLTDALQYLGGSCSVCMIDNTHMVVLHRPGREMVPVPEMQAFSKRYGFEFKAHEKGGRRSLRSRRTEVISLALSYAQSGKNRVARVLIFPRNVAQIAES